MPSSKEPGEIVFIPPKVLEFSRTNMSVICNPPPEQRTTISSLALGRANLVDQVALAFLKKVFGGEGCGFPANVSQQKFPKVAMLFIGSDVLGTAVVAVHEVCWSDVQRMDFVHPKGFDKIFLAPNFWTPFVLVFAKVKEDAPLFAIEDSEGAEFIKAVQQYGADVGIRSAKKPCWYCNGLETGKKENVPYLEPHETTWVCPFCGQNWWAYNRSMELWKASDAEEVFVVRQEEPTFIANPRRRDGEEVQSFLIPNNVRVKFEAGEQIQITLPAIFRMQPGHTFMCDAGDGYGQIVTVGERLPLDGKLQSYTVKRCPSFV